MAIPLNLRPQGRDLHHQVYPEKYDPGNYPDEIPTFGSVDRFTQSDSDSSDSNSSVSNSTDSDGFSCNSCSDDSENELTRGMEELTISSTKKNKKYPCEITALYPALSKEDIKIYLPNEEHHSALKQPNCLEGSLETPIFVPSHPPRKVVTWGGDVIIFIVVREGTYEKYRELYEDTVCGIIRLPSKMKGVEHDVEDGGVGYARLFIQRFARVVGFPYIFMIDDDLHTVKRVRQQTDKYGELEKTLKKEDNGNAKLVDISILQMLGYLEDQFYDPSLHKGCGEPDEYGAIGCRIFHMQKKVKNIFTKTRVLGLFLLNIKALYECDPPVEFPPIIHKEDIVFCQRVIDNDLLICKYNCFFLWFNKK